MGVAQSSGPNRFYMQKVKLGEGSFGVVWRAIDKRDESTVAIKQINKTTMQSRGGTRKMLDEEIRILRACQHPNVIQLLDVWEDNSNVNLALSYCDGGDLGDKLKQLGKRLQEDQAAAWTRDICSAIDAVHSKSICHRDIKPDNFMLSQGHLMLADFGFATFVQPGKPLKEKVGTPAFMAPEMDQAAIGGYGPAVDMWAAGILMYMMMNGGRHPFITDNGAVDASARRDLTKGTLAVTANQGTLSEAIGQLSNAVGISSQHFSDEACRLCKGMLSPCPKVRVSAKMALQSPWLASRPTLLAPAPRGGFGCCSAGGKVPAKPTPRTRGLAADADSPICRSGPAASIVAAVDVVDAHLKANHDDAATSS